MISPAMAIESRNPATGALLATFEPIASAEVELKLQRAVAAFSHWRTVSFDERAGLMLRIADRLEAEAGALGRLMTLEMGKPVAAGRDEALKCARGCRYYAQHAAQFLADEDAPTEARRSYIRYDPIGAILAIMPWNFPFWQVFRFAAPALMAGNVGLLKHAPNVPQCALAIERIFRETGAPEGCSRRCSSRPTRCRRCLRTRASRR